MLKNIAQDAPRNNRNKSDSWIVKNGKVGKSRHCVSGGFRRLNARLFFWKWHPVIWFTSCCSTWFK